MTESQPQSSGVSRRSLLVGGGAALMGAPALLTSCSNSGGGKAGAGGKKLKFWNMPWGNATFNKLDKQIATAYAPKGGRPGVTWQQVQWANYIQVFSTALASGTGPAVSGGGGTQAFLFASQGFIAYADHLIDTWKQNGLYDDFLPGLFDTMKTPKGHVSVPYNLDLRVIWYNKSLLQKAGAKPPTDWQSYLDACAALKKIGVYGFNADGNPGSGQELATWMINNGGGLFDDKQQPNCVTPENIEAVDFLLELVHKGYSDPHSVSYTSNDVITQWRDHKCGLGVNTAGLAENIGGTVQNELALTSPLTSPSGKKGALFFPNPTMMYKESPSQADSEAFLTYYYRNMAPLWTQNTGIGLPVLKSLTQTKAFRSNKNYVKVIDEWLPISQTWAAPGGRALFLNVTTVDGDTPAISQFEQSVLGGKTDAKSALTTLQNALKSTMRS